MSVGHGEDRAQDDVIISLHSTDNICIISAHTDRTLDALNFERVSPKNIIRNTRVSQDARYHQPALCKSTFDADMSKSAPLAVVDKSCAMKGDSINAEPTDSSDSSVVIIETADDYPCNLSELTFHNYNELIHFESTIHVVSCQNVAVDGLSISESIYRRLNRIYILNQINSANTNDLILNDANCNEIMFLVKNSQLSWDQNTTMNHKKYTATNLIREKLHHYIKSDRDVMWIGMQVRWVIWTLAAKERYNLQSYLGRLLTFQGVYDCVCHRYRVYSRQNPFTPMSLMDSVEQSNNARFTKSGSMSPLQRCTDIQTLVWPIVVCVSIQGTTNTDGQRIRSDGEDVPQRPVKLPRTGVSIECTDGWWWTKTLLDTELEMRVQQACLYEFMIRFHVK